MSDLAKADGESQVAAAPERSVPDLERELAALQADRDSWKELAQNAADEWVALSDALGEKGKIVENPLERVRDLIAKIGEQGDRIDALSAELSSVKQLLSRWCRFYEEIQAIMSNAARASSSGSTEGATTGAEAPAGAQGQP